MILAAAGKKAGVDYADIRVTTDIDPETGQRLKDGEPVVDGDGKPVMYEKAGKDVRAMSTLGPKGQPGRSATFSFFFFFFFSGTSFFPSESPAYAPRNRLLLSPFLMGLFFAPPMHAPRNPGLIEKACHPAGVLDINLGRMPIVVTPQGSVGQRKGIDSYLADSFGLNGDTPFDRAKIVAIDEALGEMMAAWGKLMPSKDGATDEEKAENAAAKLKVWFSESASKDYCGPSDMKNRERYAMVRSHKVQHLCWLAVYKKSCALTRAVVHETSRDDLWR
eukprot:SAG31_NODE_2274_length_6037_cov_18.022061_5_plen_277_part_00